MMGDCLQIRKATVRDLPAMLDLYASARKFMAENGNPDQWGDCYPQRALLEQDLCDGSSYVCVNGAHLAAAFFFRKGPDMDYEKIYQGAWLNDSPYAVVHRIAAFRKTRGAATACLDWCFAQWSNLRIDTHRKNIPMQRLLEKNGFSRCGIIYPAYGDERIAYQKYQ